MTIRPILSGIFIFQLIMSPAAFAANGCGVNSGSDPFLYEVIRQSYVYSELQLRGKQEGSATSCTPIQQVIAVYNQYGGGMAGCQAIASCAYIKQFEKEFGARNWQKGKAGEDHCFRGPESPVWEKTVCAEIEKGVLEARAKACPGGRCPDTRANPQSAMLVPTPPGAGSGVGAGGGAGGGAGVVGAAVPPSSSSRAEYVAPGAVSATSGQGSGQGGYTATVPAQQTSVVYQNVPPSSSGSTSIDSKWLWGLGGAALGVGVGYLIWGNQYKTNYVPYYQSQPTWNNLGSNAWGQVPGRYTPYGAGAFGQTNSTSTSAYTPYGLGGSYQLRQPPGMISPVW